MNMTKVCETIMLLFLTGLIAAAANSVGYPVELSASIPGVLILCAIAALGYLLAQLPYLKKLPTIFWVSVVGIAAATVFPWSTQVLEYTRHVNFLAICTPVLAYAGLAVGKDLEMFKSMSWKIVPVALAVFAGTFLFAAILAQFTLHWEGAI
jgi:hypothetical protein